MINAKEYLEELLRDNANIETKLGEIDRLKNLATNISVVTSDIPIQSSDNNDKIGKIISDLADKKAELQRLSDEFDDKMNKRINVIKQLKDTLQYIVLHKRYIQFKSFSSIAKEENYTYDYILKKHAAGIKEIQKILNSSY